MSTSAAFPSSLFEHIVVNSCSESSIRFVRGSSSRYCCVAGDRSARRQTRAQDRRQEAGWTGDGLTDPQYDIAQGAREPPDVVSRHAANARWTTPGTQTIPEARTHPIGEWASANEWAEWNPFPVSVPVGVGGVEVEKPNQPGLVRQPSEDGSMGDQNPVRTRTTPPSGEARRRKSARASRPPVTHRSHRRAVHCNLRAEPWYTLFHPRAHTNASHSPGRRR